jgi:8-oxo-dGTP pyrophosphatase MutT (NUDIX family)
LAEAINCKLSGESVMETALRETEEESGLKVDQLKVIPGFPSVVSWLFDAVVHLRMFQISDLTCIIPWKRRARKFQRSSPTSWQRLPWKPR